MDGSWSFPPVRKHRPVLIFNHNPKAGGGSILEVLKDSMNQCRKLGKHSHLEEEPACFKRKYEFASTDYSDRRHGFVIGSVREPCSHYLSLWAYGFANKGRLHNHLMQKHPARVSQEYGVDAPLFNTTGDIARFNKWLRSDEIFGIITDRFINSYVDAVPEVDCWVFVENFQTSLVECLRRYEAQGGRIDWNAHKLSSLVQMAEEHKGERELKFNDENYTKDDPIGNPQTFHHAPCSTYFDADTSKLIENGPDSIIYGLFGYEGCCKPERVPRIQDMGHSEVSMSSIGIAPWALFFQALVATVFFGIIYWACGKRNQKDPLYTLAPDNEDEKSLDDDGGWMIAT